MPRYEFSEGTSNKFWEIELKGAAFTTTYGKIGTSGSTTLKEFKSEADAKKEYDKLVAEKVKKGYQPAGGAKPAAAAAAPAPAAKKAKATPPPEEEDDDEDDDEDGEDDDAAAPVPKAKPAGGGLSGERYFEFIDGTSSKFWAVSMTGNAVCTRYGKIGTPGQKTLKEFDAKPAATKEYDKLVAEKTKKGYQEK